MPKVYGTGSFDFKRHRFAEYPVDPDKPPESISGSAVPSSITLIEIQRDKLTKIAQANWSKTGTETKNEFDPELVKNIYDTELTVKSGSKPVPLQRVMILEVSQYLKNYLWPNFNPETASFEHIMSMILMVNEKFRENVAAWICFHDMKDMFKAFLERIIHLKDQERSLSIAEKTNYLLFMINAFQMELCLNPDLIRKWKNMVKREAKEASKRGETFQPTVTLEVKFLRNLIEEFLEVLDYHVFSNEQHHDRNDELIDRNGFGTADNASILYCERFMEFLIDLLSQLPTRRYLRPLIADVAVVAKCHLSSLYSHKRGKLFAQLVDLLQFYEGFEIKDHTGVQLTDDEVLQSHYDRFQCLQLLAFKKIPQLRELALANVGAIHKRADKAETLKVKQSKKAKKSSLENRIPSPPRPHPAGVCAYS